MRASKLASLLAAAVFPCQLAQAEDLTSTSYRARGATLSAGGSSALASTDPAPSVAARGVTLGQSSPLGVSQGASGIRLVAGFWPIVGSGTLGPDRDADGVADSLDNCLDQPNGPNAGPNDQLDIDGDDIGNVCDGDFNQDAFVGGPDFTIFLQCFNQATGAAAGPPADPTCEESDMNGDAFVGGPDFTLFLQVFNGPPGPSGR